MKPTDEMVHRMRDALEGIANLSYSEAWAALTAALSASPAGVVKPLEWGEQVHGTWHAIAVVHYSAFQDMDNGKYFVRVAFPAEDFLGPFDTLEAAKSAAFADYSARIMSAIEPAGVGVETPPPQTHVEVDRLRRMVERRDEFIISKGLWNQFKEASREAE